MTAGDPYRTVEGDDMSVSSNAKYPIAVLLGLAYIWLAIAFWGWYVMNLPINEFLLETFARQGHDISYRISIIAHDALVNVLLAAPFAIALASVKPLNNWSCVFVAVATAFVGSYWSVELSSLPLLIRSWSFWAGVCMTVVSLPLAYLAAKSFWIQSEIE